MMTEEQFERFLDLQFAQLTVLHGIFNCMQAANVGNAATRGNVGMMNFKDAKKILDSAKATRAIE